jgi:hypothetical protein
VISAVLNTEEHPASRQAKWFYLKRFKESLNWVYLFLSERIQRFSAPRDKHSLAHICLKMILAMGCDKFVLSSFNFLGAYFLSH